MFDAVAYLASKGLRGKPVSGGREVTYPCWVDCAEPGDSTKRKLYVNAETGLWQCKVCGVQGGPWSMQRHFGDEPASGTSDDVYMRQRILDAATDVGVSMLRNSDDALLYLLIDRGLSEQTIIDRKLGFVTGGWSLVGSLPEGVTAAQLKSTGLVIKDGKYEGKDFFRRHILIPITRHGHTLSIRGRAWGEVRGGKYMSGPGEPVRAFNIDSLEGAEEVILTEGEFDAMILHQTLQASGDPRAMKIAVLGLSGTNAIPDDLPDLLTDIKRIYIGFDSDADGRREADKLKDKLGTRARVIDLPYENARKCDWTEYLLPAQSSSRTWKSDHPYCGHTWRDVMRLLSYAAGRRVFSVAESGDAYRAFKAINSGLKTGYRELDSAIKPGMLPGQLMVALAKTGAGKTLWLCNLAYNMRARRVLFLSLEMTREEIYDRLRRIYLFHHPHASDHDIDVAYANVYICDENRVSEKEFAALISEFVLEVGEAPDVVFVDYLGYYARGAKGNSPYEKVTNGVMQLKAEAKKHRFAIIAPSQVNRVAKEGKPIDLDDARDSGAIEETADFLLALFRPDDALSADGLTNQVPPSGKLKMTILKSRHGNKGRVCSLQVDLLTLAVVDDNTPAAGKARDHTRMATNGWEWEDLRRQETAPVQLQMNEGAIP